jgi:hypothetical protein
MRLAADCNGNYAVQAAVTHLKDAGGAAVLARLAESSEAWTLRDFACHPYGCRVVQRIIEHCPGGVAAGLLDLLCELVEDLACDRLGPDRGQGRQFVGGETTTREAPPALHPRIGIRLPGATTRAPDRLPRIAPWPSPTR